MGGENGCGRSVHRSAGPRGTAISGTSSPGTGRANVERQGLKVKGRTGVACLVHPVAESTGTAATVSTVPARASVPACTARTRIVGS